MQNTKEILKWHLNFAEMKYAAEHVFSRETKNIFDISIKQLVELSERLPDGNKLPEKKLIKDVYLQFQKECHKEYFYLFSQFSRRDVRILVWALDYKTETGGRTILLSDKFRIAIKIIEGKWKDFFIIRLWHILLKNWNDLLVFEDQRALLTTLLYSKCKKYDKTRKDILRIIKNINFFIQKDSPFRFAKYLITNKKFIKDAHILMKQKEYILVYEFFSSVVEKYIELLEKETVTYEVIRSIYQFLVLHNNKKTTIITCSQIINTNKFNQFIEVVKNQTVTLIGDPIKEHLWRLNGLSRTQEEYVASARKKLNILLNQHFIKVFFEKLVQDDRRKKYWLKFIDKIDDIKFSGSRDNYRYLKNIESVSKYVDSRYKTTSRNQSTCALIIYSKNFVFIEFTDIGALYIYKHNNFRVNLNAIDGMEDLKIWSKYIYACKNSDTPGYVDLNEEGRITHQGYWEDRVEVWMNKYYH